VSSWLDGRGRTRPGDLWDVHVDAILVAHGVKHASLSPSLVAACAYGTRYRRRCSDMGTELMMCYVGSSDRSGAVNKVYRNEIRLVDELNHTGTLQNHKRPKLAMRLLHRLSDDLPSANARWLETNRFGASWCRQRVLGKQI
jgi:hypothetical protein